MKYTIFSIILLSFLSLSACNPLTFITTRKNDSTQIDKFKKCHDDMVITRNSLPSNMKISDTLLENICNPVSKALTVQYNLILSNLRAYKSVEACPTCVNDIDKYCEDVSKFKATCCDDNSTAVVPDNNTKI